MMMMQQMRNLRMIFFSLRLERRSRIKMRRITTIYFRIDININYIMSSDDSFILLRYKNRMLIDICL